MSAGLGRAVSSLSIVGMPAVEVMSNARSYGPILHVSSWRFLGDWILDLILD